MRYAQKLTADSYGEYREGRQIRPEKIAGTTISEQLPGMLRRMRMDGSIILEGNYSNALREEGETARGMRVRPRPSS